MAVLRATEADRFAANASALLLMKRNFRRVSPELARLRCVRSSIMSEKSLDVADLFYRSVISQ